MKTIQEEPLYVNGRRKKTWRVFENLYGNIYKYAMDNTRVYVDITRQNDKVIIFIRNISASPLNFNAKELTERFIEAISQELLKAVVLIINCKIHRRKTKWSDEYLFRWRFV